MTDDSLTEEQLRDAISLTIKSNGSMVEGWLKNKPGCWGNLAGQAVLACRQKLGRRLTDEERRTVWRELWKTLTELKQTS
jgi:hypothetical protein